MIDKIYTAVMIDFVVNYSERNVIYKDEYGYLLANGHMATKINEVVETDSAVFVHSDSKKKCETLIAKYISGKLKGYQQAFETSRRFI